MPGSSKSSPRGWLAFDLNVLRRMTFTSIAIPFMNESALGSYVKRWDVRVAANDPSQSTWARGFAQIGNNGSGQAGLSADDVNVVLEDAYVPGYRLNNASLTTWFNETDSWWFDNVRQRIEHLPTPLARATAASLAMQAGDYVLSFNDATRELRQPLSNVFRRLWSLQPEGYNNRQNNTVQNDNADKFISETFADMMFLRLPPAHTMSARGFMGRNAWREEWIRGGNEFWDVYEASQSSQLGAATETKSQYLHMLEETLRRASHINSWAIAHVETGFIQTQDIVETIGRIRRVDTIYTKDFSELTGTKAVIITA